MARRHCFHQVNAEQIWVQLFSGKQAKELRVVARYMVPGTPADGLPAMVLFRNGEGSVFLSGVHLEVSFDHCRLYHDDDTWKLMNVIISLLS